MNKEKVEILVEGGKATAGAQMGQKFGPLGVNIQEILKKINEKTADFKGMKVPVKVYVDKKTKEFELEIGTPPISELIKKELGVQKGSGQPDKEKIANLSIEQVIKIAKMKKDSMLVNSFKAAVKSVVGSCNSLGILIEGKKATEINKDINEGKYDHEINTQKTSVSEEKKQLLQRQLIEIQELFKKELEKLKAEEEKKEEKKEEKEEKVKEEEKKEDKEVVEEKKQKSEKKEEKTKK